MILSKDSIKLFEDYQINLPESVLIKIEDGVRNNRELLVTIDASHYGFRNNNGTIYRHDTMINDVQSFVYPDPKPIIERHRPESSAEFGKVIAADYKLTKYHADLLQDMDLDGLTTEEYIDMCRQEILPMQMKDSKFNGLAYVQVVGKLGHKEGIKKVLDGEFLSVSIGASPRKLICSECLQDQVKGICDHYAHKMSGRFMLAEELDYEELSFVPKPADPWGRVVRIHDGQVEEFKVEHDINILDTNVSVVDIKDFFQEAEGKTIVCVDNICTIINEEEQGMIRKNISLADEFSAEILKVALKDVKLQDEEMDIDVALKLNDEEAAEWTARKFAIVQKTQDGEDRRFPLHDEANVRAGLALIDQAEDLTDAEIKKAKAKLAKAAEKFNIVLSDEKTEEEKAQALLDAEAAEAAEAAQKLEDETGQKAADADTGAGDDSTDPIVVLVDSLKAELVKIGLTEEETAKLTDAELEDMVSTEAVNPQKTAVTRIFDLLKWYANDQAVAARSLNSGVTGFLEEVGKAAVDKGHYDSLETKAVELEDSVKSLTEGKTELETKSTELEATNTELTEEVSSLKDECEILEEANKDLNYELRAHLVDELVCNKIALGILTDEEVDQAKTDLMALQYSGLKMQVEDSRKLTAKLKDSVNNKVEIDTVTDPTLQDDDNSEGTESKDTPLDTLNDEDHEKSDPELVKAFVSLFR